jgi:hypothetical protein
MSTPLPRADSTLHAIERLSDAGLSAQELLDEAVPLIERVVPTDGYFIAATDPETTLSMGAGVVRDLPLEWCQPTWDYEFRVPDVMKFADLARSPRPVTDLHEATGGKPMSSPRWADYSAASGYRSELRAAFTTGGAAYGIAQMNRLGDAPRFSDAEKEWLGRVGPVLAQGLRRALVAQPALPAGTRGPGILVLDANGALLSATPEAEAWLDEVDPWMMMSAMPFEAAA